jgi:hypothetical protein
MFEFVMDSCVVDGDEMVGLQKVEKFVQQPAWVGMHKVKKVLNSIMVKRAGRRVVLGLSADNIMGFLPELIDMIPHAYGEVAAGKNVHQTKFI